MGRDFLMALAHLWTSLPFSLSPFSPKQSVCCLPAALPPFSLSSDLAQGHLQLGQLGRDIRADPTAISPPDMEGQSPMAVRYRSSTQRRFSTEASAGLEGAAAVTPVAAPLTSWLLLSPAALLTFPLYALCRMSANASPCLWTSDCPPSSCRSCRWRARSSPSRSAGCHGGHPL